MAIFFRGTDFGSGPKKIFVSHKAHDYDLSRTLKGKNVNILIKSNEESFCTERMPKSRFLVIEAEYPLTLCLLGLEVSILV